MRDLFLKPIFSFSSSSSGSRTFHRSTFSSPRSLFALKRKKEIIIARFRKTLFSTATSVLGIWNSFWATLSSPGTIRVVKFAYKVARRGFRASFCRKGLFPPYRHSAGLMEMAGFGPRYGIIRVVTVCNMYCPQDFQGEISRMGKRI